MINPLVAVTNSLSSKTGDACCIHGVGWNTCLAGEAPPSDRIKRRNTRHEQMFSAIHQYQTFDANVLRSC
jgi:hypothetical protein